MLKRETLAQECFAECLGTFILVFFGAGSVAAMVMKGNYDSFWELSVMWGLACALAIYVTGGVTGTHINPAVTICLAVFRGFDKKKIIPYIVSQIIGAFLAAAATFGLYFNNFRDYEAAEGIIRGAAESKADPKSDCLDMEAIRLIVKWLPVAVKDPENIEARYNMMLASTFAGMGFSDALVHLGHAFSECMGAKFHVAHGISCAWGLLETMTYASKYRGDKVRMVADAMGLTVPEGATDEEVGQIVADAIREFMKGIGVRSIKESGFTREDTVSIYTSIPKNLCWPSLPQPLSDDELKAWLGRVYDTYQ